MMMDDQERTLQEQVFHNLVREYIISLLLFILLYVTSYVILCQFRKKVDHEDMYSSEEDADVYRISLWLCTGTLTVSVGAVLLLPFSIVSNEVLHLYHDSYYIKFLNSSLIQGLWNYVFLFSNLALFIFMPFAYFFMEAEGFSGSRQGVMARVYEAFIVLFLVAILIFGSVCVAWAMFNDDETSKQTLIDVWHEDLPYLFSFISFIGVPVLIMCAAAGVARMFTVMGQLVVKPQFLQDIEEELNVLRLEEDNFKRKIIHLNHLNFPSKIANGDSLCRASVNERLNAVSSKIKEMEQKSRSSFWRRNLCYPIVMLLLLFITGLCVLNVIQNTVLLIFGSKALPQVAQVTVLGNSSLSSFGIVGAFVQIAVLLYLMVASVVGFYSLPYFRNLQPKRGDTSMRKIIGNCVVLLLLSSALPILSKTLGITNYDLVGKFGSMEWLGNFYIILFYNVVFAAATSLCLFKKFTATIRKEIFLRLKVAFQRSKRSSSLSSPSSCAVQDQTGTTPNQHPHQFAGGDGLGNNRNGGLKEE